MTKADIDPTTSTAPTRRDAMRDTFVALAGGAGMLTLVSDRGPVPAGALIAITRAFREAEIAFDRIDSQFPRPPEGSAEEAVFERAYTEAEHRRFEIHDSIYIRQPRTLADAAVVAGHAVSTLDFARYGDLRLLALSGDDLKNRLLNMQRAFAGILAVIAPAAGIHIRDIGWREMHVTHARVLAELEG